MDILSGDAVPVQNLRKLEELQNDNPDFNTRFDYAWALLKQKNDIDIKRGIKILEQLAQDNSSNDARRSYLLYLAAGYFKIKKFDYSLALIDKLLQQEPQNLQAQSLKETMKKKMKEDTVKGAAIVGGLAAAVGLGIYLLKR